MHPAQSLTAVAATFALALLAFSATLHAQTPTRDSLAGQYACAEARVAGNSFPCKASPLSLKTDGHFELQGRQGEYGDDERQDIKRYFPPGCVVLAACVGLFGMSWGWWQLRRNERETAWVMAVFLGGLGLWGYASFGLLRWVFLLGT